MGGPVPIPDFMIRELLDWQLFCIQLSSYIDLDVQKIIQASHEMKEKAYCPYSKFRVGAALLCQDGTVITGKSCAFIFLN